MNVILRQAMLNARQYRTMANWSAADTHFGHENVI